MDLLEIFEQAMRLDERGEVDDAVACLDEVFDRIPETAPYLKFAGQLYQRLGVDKRSLSLLRRAEALTPDDPELLLSLGYHFADNSRPDIALDYFHRHLALEPDSVAGLTYLGHVFDWLGRLEEAEIALAKALALAPTEVGTHLLLGRVRLRRGHLGEARQAFAAVGTLAPDNVLAEIGLRRVEALSRPRPSRSSAPAGTIAQTIVCVKAGTKYGPDYVNRLAATVRRYSTRDLRVVCFTDDPTGLNNNVEAQPLPVAGLTGWWNKVALFGETLPGVTGRVLYLDLDVVITSSIDPLLDHPGGFVIMDNDYVPGFNSSVMLFDVGAQPHVWTDFTPQIAESLKGDQDWMALQIPEADLWPDDWCVVYRLRAVEAPPADTKVVVFSGRPNPHEYPAEWIRDYWR